MTSLPSNVFEYEIVDPSTGLSYKKWNDLLEKSFDQYFYIGTMEENKSSPAINCNLVNKTEIIRDSLKVSRTPKWDLGIPELGLVHNKRGHVSSWPGVHMVIICSSLINTPRLQNPGATTNSVPISASHYQLLLNLYQRTML